MNSSNKHPNSIGARIALGFSLAVALMLALTIVGLNHMAQANARLKNIVEKNNVKTEMAQIMQRALRERALSMHIMAVLTDVFLKDDEYQRFNDYGNEYARARQKLESLAVSPEEKAVFSRITALTQETQPEVQKVIDLELQGNSPAILLQIRNQTMPKQRLISDQVDRLISLQQTQTAIAVREAESSSANARQAMLWLGGLASLLTTLIASIVIRRSTKQAQILEYQALHDDLTGLPNRLYFQDRLVKAIAHAKREKLSFAIILMDLDRFKAVNDTLGHNIGDLLLQEVSLRLVETVRVSDTVARLGGDEFIIILESHTEPYTYLIADKVIKTLDRPFLLNGEAVDISASLGIALYPEHGEDAITLVQRADIAMYAAKHGHSGFAMYSKTQEQSSRAALTLKSELRQAIEQDELVLYFQPKIDHHSGCVMGVEALVRWHHPKRGFLLPDQFIPAAEQTGLILPLTRWVLARALAQCAILHKSGIFINVAFNLSAKSLHDKRLPAEIASLLASANIDPAHLVLEITESTMMADQAFALEILQQLDKMGVTLAIDDFGTGYSSLAYLSRLPVDEIKIDKSFVLDMMNDKQAAVIVKSTIDLAHNLGMKVVAEGVETQEMWDALTQWGCDAAQGFHMSKALPGHELMQWLSQSNWSREKDTDIKCALVR